MTGVFHAGLLLVSKFYPVLIDVLACSEFFVLFLLAFRFIVFDVGVAHRVRVYKRGVPMRFSVGC